MPMINFANPIFLGLALMLFVGAVFLAREMKKSVVMGGALAIFVFLSVANCVILVMQGANLELRSDIVTTIVFDLIFTFISFLSYLWIDDIEARVNKKKSIDNSLDWFWKEV